MLLKRLPKEAVRFMGFAPTVGEGYREGFSVAKYSDSDDNREPRFISVKRRVDNAESACDIAGTGIEQVLIREPDLKELPANHSIRFNIDFILYPCSVNKASLLNGYQ